MTPQVRQVLDRGREAGQKSYDIITRFISWILRVVDLILDELYNRLDLWQNKERRISSFKKIRSMVLYTVVVGVIVYVVQHSFGKPPIQFLTVMLLAMLAASFGENVLMAFFEVLARRWGDLPSRLSAHDSGPPEDPRSSTTPPPGESS